MLLCIAGLLFSEKDRIARYLTEVLSFVQIYLAGQFHDPTQRQALVLECLEELDGLLIQNCDKNYVFLINSVEDWETINGRPGRLLVYIQSSETSRYSKMQRLLNGSRSKLIEALRQEFNHSHYGLIDDLFTEMFTKEREDAIFDILNSIYQLLPRKELKAAEAYANAIISSYRNPEYSIPSLVILGADFFKYEKVSNYKDLRLRSWCVCDISSDEGTEAIDEVLKKISDSQGDNRPTWDEYFMNIARMVSMKSSCINKSGAVLINKNGRIMCTGWSDCVGTKEEMCIFFGCMKCINETDIKNPRETCFCIHAIQLALFKCGLRSIDYGSTIYATDYPCVGCSKIILQCSGISKIVYDGNSLYGGYPPHDLLTRPGIEVRPINNR